MMRSWGFDMANGHGWRGNDHVLATVALLLGSGLQIGAASGQGTLTGVFGVIFGDPPPGSALPPHVTYRLTDDTGRTTEIRLSDRTLQAVGGTIALNRQRVTVTGAPTTEADGATAISVQTIKVETKSSATVTRQAVTTGPQPFLNVLCRFSDEPTTDPISPAYMDGLMSSIAPGLGDFFSQTSFGKINLNGTTTVGWFILPHVNCHTRKPTILPQIRRPMVSPRCNSRISRKIARNSFRRR